MDHPLAMDVYQPPSDISKLGKLSGCQWTSREDNEILNGKPTSPNRSSPGCVLMNSLMFPSAIHSDTIAKWVSVIVTPISGSTFGCRSDFHITTSPQNLYMGLDQRIDKQKDSITHANYLL